MPEYPEEALAAAASAIQVVRYGNLQHLGDEYMAREALNAAAPILAEAVAQKILAHMEHHDPGPGISINGVPIDPNLAHRWRRCFRTAARIAAGAFYTEAEMKQQAARALVSGSYVACDIPESGAPDA